MFVDELFVRLTRYPSLLRPGLALMRATKPVAQTGSNFWVFSADAVREVFERSHEFLPGPAYTPRIKITGGPCLLGVDHSQAYDGEQAALWPGLGNTDPRPITDEYRAPAPRAIDPPAIAKHFENLVESEYTAQIAQLPNTGPLDVGALIERVLVRSFARFYGVDADAARSSSLKAQPGLPTLANWLRVVGSLIAMPVPAPWGFEEAGTRLGAEFSAFLVEQAKRTAPATGREFVSLLADLRAAGALAKPEDAARAVGVMMLAGTTTIKAVTLALHELLLRTGSGGACAVRAAQRGDQAEVFAYAQEALRFRPVFPFLARVTKSAVVLGEGTEYRTEIPANSQIGISPMSAMFDAKRVRMPQEFIVGRPAEVYLHFGHETHHPCTGRHLAATALRVLLTHLLAERAMRPGVIKYEGAAIASYVVEQTRYVDSSVMPRRPEKEAQERGPRADVRQKAQD
jgi:cytochrome P450